MFFEGIVYNRISNQTTIMVERRELNRPWTHRPGERAGCDASPFYLKGPRLKRVAHRRTSEKGPVEL